MEKLDFALHVLYVAADNYPCEDCDFRNSCLAVKGDGCVVKEAFDTVHQEILRIKD